MITINLCTAWNRIKDFIFSICLFTDIVVGTRKYFHSLLLNYIMSVVVLSRFKGCDTGVSVAIVSNDVTRETAWKSTHCEKKTETKCKKTDNPLNRQIKTPFESKKATINYFILQPFFLGDIPVVGCSVQIWCCMQLSKKTHVTIHA